MTHMMVQIPARVAVAPRGAEPLANTALLMVDVFRRAGKAVLKASHSRHLGSHAAGHAAKTETPCAGGIGVIKG